MLLLSSSLFCQEFPSLILQQLDIIELEVSELEKSLTEQMNLTQNLSSYTNELEMSLEKAIQESLLLKQNLKLQEESLMTSEVLQKDLRSQLEETLILSQTLEKQSVRYEKSRNAWRATSIVLTVLLATSVSFCVLF